MFWFCVWQVVSTLIELIRLGRRSESDKDFEILLLRRQLAIYERRQEQAPHLSRGEKLMLIVMGTKLKAQTGRTIKAMGEVIRIVKPTTLFGWHKQLVRRKWTYRQRQAGRPRTDRAIEQLVLRLARENDWGYERIEGELLKLGYDISHETVGHILQRHRIPPAPEREPSPSWRHLMTHYKDQLLACDFFTVETLFLHTLYVLVFIEIGTRRVHFAGCTAHPDSAWVTQQARQVMWELADREPGIRFLIRDNDKKFTESFDTVFRAEGIDIIRTPFRAPNANAYVERWIRSARTECLDKLLIINQAHLRRVMREYIAFFNTARPHQGLDQQIPVSKFTHANTGPLCCRPVLGGIIHDYYRDAA
ncbi:MAG TPA: integrase core domain-containing protein [Aggregatilineaceae bacterium]|nr:integrase core domain-containing protein [Aggregatilineaceae bacterium]